MRSARQALAAIAALCDEPTDIGLPRGKVMVEKLRAVLADVEPEPVQVQTINRAALVALLGGLLWTGKVMSDEEIADAILALLRPVEGVTLTREEAAIIIDAGRAHLGIQGGRLSDVGFRERVEKIVARLEAALQ